jgi:hypothetical protein
LVSHASSLILFAQGGAELTGGFCLKTLSYCGPTSIMGPILNTVVVSHDVAGVSCEELGWHVNMCLLHPFTMPVMACHFTSSVVTPRGHKVGNRPCVNLHPLARSPIASSLPSLWLERNREIDLETGDIVVELTESCFSFPSKPWQGRARSHRKSCWSTYRTS